MRLYHGCCYFGDFMCYTRFEKGQVNISESVWFVFWLQIFVILCRIHQVNHLEEKKQRSTLLDKLNVNEFYAAVSQLLLLWGLYMLHMIQNRRSATFRINIFSFSIQVFAILWSTECCEFFQHWMARQYLAVPSFGSIIHFLSHVPHQKQALSPSNSIVGIKPQNLPCPDKKGYQSTLINLLHQQVFLWQYTMVHYFLTLAVKRRTNHA